MPIPKKLERKHRISTYIDQLAKFKIGLWMNKNNVQSYSEFLRLAIFFLINNNVQKPTKTTVWDGWKAEKDKVISLDIKELRFHSEVINELKTLFQKGEKILKKFEEE